ncbi:hypothetical protein Scep_002184 [Stephania cephalantha]|uniref:Isopenicillin N synthase-like Fe(2+) 2OG dioxygenase domain-containing protein n=1 Tax=Stephania cephalantha TaxID=152367 RepID=A0AAP0L9J9_9MAGN
MKKHWWTPSGSRRRHATAGGAVGGTGGGDGVGSSQPISYPNEAIQLLRRDFQEMQTHIFRVMQDHTLTQDQLREVQGQLRRMEQALMANLGFHSRQRLREMFQLMTQKLTTISIIELTSFNFDLFTAPAANWRDSLGCVMAPACPNPEDLPIVLSTLINDFLTVVLQDRIGGLQVLYQGYWIDVPPIQGGLIINAGDLLQLVSNDRFKSSEHRVLAKNVGPTTLVACLFTMHSQPSTRVYGPIKELISEENPALYRDTTLTEYMAHLNEKGREGNSGLIQFFRLR